MKLSEIKKQIASIQADKLMFKDFETVWEKRKCMRQIIEQKYRKFTGRIWIFGDLHLPYMLRNLVFDKLLPSISEFQVKRKMIILPGDTFTFDLFSWFRKGEGRTAKPSEEIREGKKLFQTLNKIANYVLMLKTNHEVRLEKFLADKIQGNEEIEETKVFLKSFQELFAEIPSLQVVDDWLVQIGDIIVPHGGPGSRAVKGRTGTWGIDFFLGAGRHLVRKEWRVLFQPHSHLLSSILYRDKRSVEVGCLCKPLDYQFKGSKSYSFGKYGDWQRGYGVCNMVDGKVDINSAMYMEL